MKKLSINRTIRKIVLVLGIISIVCIVVFVGISVFTIKEIIVEPTDISIVLDKDQLPTNLLLFPTDRLRALVRDEYPSIQDVEFIKLYPNTLKVVVVPRIPVAYIVEDKRRVAIDSDGILFLPLKDIELPVIEVPLLHLTLGKAAVGDGITTSLAFIEELGHDEPIERITMSTNSTLDAKLKDVHILFLSNADGKEIARTLQALLKGFRMKGALPQMVDLRYSKPIITP